MQDYSKEVQSVLKRVTKAEVRKLLWVDTYDEAYEYFLPQKEYQKDNTKGQKRNLTKQYSSVPRTSMKKFANRMQNVMMPSGTQWAALQAGESVKKEFVDKVNRDLQEITDIVFQYINSSNIDTELGECFQDLGVGTAGLLIEDTGDADDPLRFKAIPVADLILEEGPFGMIDTVFRKFKVTTRNCMRRYPSLPADYHKDTNPDDKVEIIEAVIYNPKTKMFDFYAIDRKKTYLLDKKTGIEVSPWVISRWATSTGEIYGRGPAIDALPDAITLNEITRLELKGAAFAIAGPMAYDPKANVSFKNTKIEPETFVPVPTEANLRPLSDLASSKFQITNIQEERLADRLQTSMYANNLPPPTGQARTATEIQIRQRELQQDIGAAFGRVQREMIVPIIERVIYILTKYGKLKPLRIDDKRLVNIKVTSPIARNNDDIDLMNAYLGTLGQFAELIGPENIQNTLKGMDIPKWYATTMGVDMDILKSDEEMKDAAEAAKQDAEEAKGLVQAKEGSEVAKNLGVDGQQAMEMLEQAGGPNGPKQ